MITAADWRLLLQRTSLLVREQLNEAVRGGVVGVPLLRAGVVANPGVQSVVTVKCDGDLAPIEAVNLTNAALPAGCRVMVIFTPPHGVYVGFVLGAPISPHVGIIRVNPLGDRSTASSSYVNIPSEVVVVPFVKYRPDTVLVVDVRGSNLYTAGGAGTTFLGFRVDGVDYDAAVEDLVTSPRKTMTGFNIVAGLAAGAYDVTMRVKIASNTFHADTLSLLMMSVTEQLPG